MGSLVGAIASPLIGGGLNALFGTGKKNKNVLNFGSGFDLGPPLDFSGDLGAGSVGLDYGRPALTGSNLSAGGYRLGTTLNPDGTVSSGLDSAGSFGATTLGPRLSRSLADIDALRAGLTPGFGKVTQARRGAIETARQRAVGDLRDTLARRRVEGSSFGNASIAQAEAEFGKAAAEADAQSYLEELDATTQLIAQENDLTYREATRALDELKLGAQYSQSFADLFARDAQIRQSLAAQDLAGRRQLYGQDLTSRRNVGVADLGQRRNLAADEESRAGSFFGGIGSGIGKALAGLF